MLCNCGERLTNYRTRNGSMIGCMSCGRVERRKLNSAQTVTLAEEPKEELEARVEAAQQWAKNKVAEWEGKFGTAYKDKLIIAVAPPTPQTAKKP